MYEADPNKLLRKAFLEEKRLERSRRINTLTEWLGVIILWGVILAGIAIELSKPDRLALLYAWIDSWLN